MFNYRRTPRIQGRYAYRAWDGRWYVIDDHTGEYTGLSADTRSDVMDIIAPNRLRFSYAGDSR